MAAAVSVWMVQPASSLAIGEGEPEAPGFALVEVEQEVQPSRSTIRAKPNGADRARAGIGRGRPGRVRTAVPAAGPPRARQRWRPRPGRLPPPGYPGGRSPAPASAPGGRRVRAP